jgi:hypothetical protein
MGAPSSQQPPRWAAIATPKPVPQPVRFGDKDAFVALVLDQMSELGKPVKEKA